MPIKAGPPEAIEGAAAVADASAVAKADDTVVEEVGGKGGDKEAGKVGNADGGSAGGKTEAEREVAEIEGGGGDGCA